jgi:hypothetical protein
VSDGLIEGKQVVQEGAIPLESGAGVAQMESEKQARESEGEPADAHAHGSQDAAPAAASFDAASAAGSEIDSPATSLDDHILEEVPLADFAPQTPGYAPQGYAPSGYAPAPPLAQPGPTQQPYGAAPSGHVPPPPQGYPPQYPPPGYPPPGYGYPPAYPPPGYGYPPPGYGYPPPGYGYPPPGYFPPASLPYQTAMAFPQRHLPDPGRLPAHLLIFGIISILWGGIALIVHLISVPTVMQAYKESVPPPPPAVPTMPAMTPAAPYDGDVVGPRGFSADTRQAVSAVVDKRLKLSSDRSAMFEWFLADVGQDIFGGDVGTNADAINAKIVSVTPSAENGDGADLFTTAQGRVVINDNDVVFAAGSGASIRLDGTVLRPLGQPAQWSSRALKHRIEAMRPAPNTYGRTLTAQQITVVLRHMRELPVQSWSRPSSVENFVAVPIEKLSLQYGLNSWATVQAKGQRLRIYPDGREVSESAFYYGTDADGNPLPAPTRRFKPAMPGSLAVIRWLPYQAMANAALALLLLVSGIALVAKIPGSCRIHRLWCYLRMIVGVGSLALTIVWASSLPPTSRERDDVGFTLLSIAITIGYALIMLGVLGTAGARKYFAHHQTGEHLFSPAAHKRWRMLVAQPKWRFTLLAVAILAAIGCFLHGKGFSSSANDDSTKVGHALLFAAAVAVLVFSGRGLLSAVLMKRKTATTAAAMIVLLTSSASSLFAQPTSNPAETPPSTGRRVVAPESQIAFANMHIRQLKALPPNVSESNRRGKIFMLQMAMEERPEGQRVVFEALPTLNHEQALIVIDSMDDAFGRVPIDPVAHPAAIAAIPILVEKFEMDTWTAKSHAGIILRKIADIEGAGPKMLEGLKASNLPPQGIATFLANTKCADEAFAYLKAILADDSDSADRRASAVSGLLVFGDKGRVIVRSVMDGSHPSFAALERYYEKPDPDSTAQARHDESTKVRIKAMSALHPAANSADLSNATIEALTTALKSRSPDVRLAAAHALIPAGPASISRVIEFFGQAATSEECGPLAEELASALGYPPLLLKDQKTSDAATRKGLAAVFDALAPRYNPSLKRQNLDASARSLLSLLKDPDPEVERQAAILVRTRVSLYGADPGFPFESLIDSKVSEVSELALLAILSKRKSAWITSQQLIRGLATKDDELRDLVVNKLRTELRSSDQSPAPIVALLGSENAGVRSAAATVLSEPQLRRKVGPVTLKRLDEVTGNQQTTGVIPNDLAARKPWPRPPAVSDAPGAAPTSVEKSAESKGPWPAGFVTLAALIGVLLLGIAALRGRHDDLAASQASG